MILIGKGQISSSATLIESEFVDKRKCVGQKREMGDFFMYKKVKELDVTGLSAYLAIVNQAPYVSSRRLSEIDFNSRDSAAIPYEA